MQPDLPNINLDFIYLTIYRIFTGGVDGGSFNSFLRAIAPYSIVISALLLGVTIFCAVRIYRLRTDFYTDLRAQIKKNTNQLDVQKNVKNLKWQQVKEHMDSVNPSDWRLAILEADVMLEELVRVMGYQGETLGEKLRSANKGSFATLDQAWEAHRIRNQIAHQGSEYELTEREARKTVELYRVVFEEFDYI